MTVRGRRTQPLLMMAIQITHKEEMGSQILSLHDSWAVSVSLGLITVLQSKESPVVQLQGGLKEYLYNYVVSPAQVERHSKFEIPAIVDWVSQYILFWAKEDFKKCSSSDGLWNCFSCNNSIIHVVSNGIKCDIYCLVSIPNIALLVPPIVSDNNYYYAHSESSESYCVTGFLAKFKLVIITIIMKSMSYDDFQIFLFKINSIINSQSILKYEYKWYVKIYYTNNCCLLQYRSEQSHSPGGTPSNLL